MLKTVLPISLPVNIYFLYGSNVCCLSQQQQGSFYLKACLGKPLRIHLTSETSVLNDGKIPNSEHRLKGNHIKSKIFQNGKLRLVQLFQELHIPGWFTGLILLSEYESHLWHRRTFSFRRFFLLFMLIKMRVHLKILCNYYPFTHTNNISQRVSPISPAARLEET